MTSHTDSKKHLSRLRHDLRTPLNAIIGYSEMILEDIEDSDQDNFKSSTPEIHHYIKNMKKIHTTGSNMATQVNKILDPEKINTEETIDFEFIASQLSHEFQPYADIIIQCSKILIQKTENLFEEDFIEDIEKIYSAVKNFMFQIADFAKNPSCKNEFKKSQSSPEPVTKISVSSSPKNKPDDSKPNDSKRADSGGLLVVDDNEMNRDILCRHLERQGYLTMVAKDGYHAFWTLDKLLSAKVH